LRSILKRSAFIRIVIGFALYNFSARRERNGGSRADPTRRDVCPNLEALLSDPSILKIFTITGVFDIAVLFHRFRALTAPVDCTKIASRLVRTYTDRHGLKDLTRELLGVEISKQQQSSDWGATELTEAQCAYAASDALNLHALKDKLEHDVAP